MKKLLTLSALLTIPTVLISTISCGGNNNTNEIINNNDNMELNLSQEALKNYENLFAEINEGDNYTKLQKSFIQLNDSSTNFEQKSEVDVLKIAQEFISNKTDEEIRQIIFRNVLKGGWVFKHMNSTIVDNYQTFLYDIQSFIYDRVNSTISFNYIINYYESYKDKQEYRSVKLNYRFKDIKIEAATIQTQQNNNGTLGKNIILPIIKFVEIQPDSASVSLVNYNVDSYISSELGETAIRKNELWKKVANTRLEATKQFKEIGKENGKLTFSSLFDAIQQSIYYKPNANILTVDDTILFSSSTIDSFVNFEYNQIENLNLSVNCWAFLFGYDYYINLKELENNSNIVLVNESSSKIATTNFYLVDIDPETQEQTKWIAYETIK